MLQDICGVCYIRTCTNMFISGASILQLRLVSHMFIHQYTVV
jgi:hypothetical protein